MKPKKIAIKISTIIITILITLVILSVFATAIVFKKEFEKRDKNDVYWNYNKILQQPFKYLNIDGGNVTHIIFEPSKKPSVRVLKRWLDFKEDSAMIAFVRNDTLYLKIKNKYKNLNQKDWMESEVLVRLFAPQILSVDGYNTNFEMKKMKQSNFIVNLKGKSRLEVETYNRNFDSLKVMQRDSSQVIFEISPDLKASPMMHFKHVTANMTGYTLLDVGRSYIDNIKLNISDSSAIILSGQSIKTTELVHP